MSSIPTLESNDAIGDSLHIPKSPSLTRIHFQNADGINVTPGGTWQSLCETWKSLEVDLGLTVETKLDTTKPSVRSQLYETASKVFEHSSAFKLEATSTPIQADTNHKPGGILQLVTGHHQSRLDSKGSDAHGRWTHMTFRRKSAHPVTIITTYQVHNCNPHTAGPTTYASQLLSQYVLENRNQPHLLRKHHHRDLIAFIQSLQQQHHSILLTGDFNETFDDPTPNGMSQLCSACNLIDPITAKFGPQQFKTWLRADNPRVIDHVLVTSDLLPAITHCGYEPFQAHIHSDHRGIFLDVDTSLFFGDSHRPFSPKHSRDIVSTKAHQIAPYFRAKDQHLTDHNWYHQMAEIEDLVTHSDTVTNSQLALADKLYNRLVLASKHAGKQLPKYSPVPYSPEIIRLRQIRNILKVICTHKATTVDLTHEIEELQTKLGSFKVPVPDTLEESRRAHAQASKDYWLAIRDEVETRKARRRHLETLRVDAQASGDRKRDKILSYIQKAEANRPIFGKLRKLRDLIPSSGLTHLLVPSDPDDNPKTCTDWKRVDVPEEIVALLEERNRKHFGQSKNCNLTSDPTDFTMAFAGACARADAILNGTYPTDNLDELTKILLEAFQYSSEPDKIPYSLHPDEYLGKLRVWDERTSTSPGTDMHLGHLKAYYAQHSLPEGSDAAKDLEDLRSKILAGHLTLLNFALKFGHSYHPWKKVVNAMLEKEPGNPKIHRLRVIHLYEADYNLILSVKWRQLLNHACASGFVNESHFGSQPGKEALDAVFIRELEYELTRLTRKSLIHFDNDATSCYDRIPCFLANVASRKFGMHRNVCIVQGRTLAEARYHLKTQLGISDEFVQHSREHPWFGTGQGSGNSPMYWLFISSVLFDIYEDQATGATYESPDRSMQIQLKIVGFVDDTRNSENQFSAHPQPTMDDLVRQATTDSQAWHDILLSANQALELPKCGYHAMQYSFQEDGTPTLEENPTAPDLVLRQGSRGGTSAGDGNTDIAIARWPTSKATKYLGCQECPAGKGPQLKVTTKKCNQFGHLVQSNHLTPREAQVLYWTIYKPSVGYPLPMSHFTFKELDKAQNVAHRSSSYFPSIPPNTLDSAMAFLLLEGRMQNQNQPQNDGNIPFWLASTTLDGSLPSEHIQLQQPHNNVTLSASVSGTSDSNNMMINAQYFASSVGSARRPSLDTGQQEPFLASILGPIQEDDPLDLPNNRDGVSSSHAAHHLMDTSRSSTSAQGQIQNGPFTNANNAAFGLLSLTGQTQSSQNRIHVQGQGIGSTQPQFVHHGSRIGQESGSSGINSQHIDYQPLRRASSLAPSLGLPSPPVGWDPNGGRRQVVASFSATMQAQNNAPATQTTSSSSSDSLLAGTTFTTDMDGSVRIPPPSFQQNLQLPTPTQLVQYNPFAPHQQPLVQQSEQIPQQAPSAVHQLLVLQTPFTVATNTSPNIASTDQGSTPEMLPPETQWKGRGRSSTFPLKLHQMLLDLEQSDGGTEIASFLQHGRGFQIHKPKEFATEVLPHYFRMSTFSSFQRQLNLYDFQRILEGPEKGAYFHRLFLKDQPMLSTGMKRSKVKGTTRARQVERLKDYHGQQPSSPQGQPSSELKKPPRFDSDHDGGH